MEPEPGSRDELARNLLDALRIAGRSEPANELHERVLDPLLDDVFAEDPGIIWSTIVTFNGETLTLAGMDDNSLRLQTIEPDPPNAFVSRDVPYEPIQYWERRDYFNSQLEFRARVPRFGEIVGGPVKIDSPGKPIGRTFRNRAKGLT
jgi:hypothetical protein